MSCFALDKPCSIWYLTGDNSGYGDKFLPAINGLCNYQEIDLLKQQNNGKDFDVKTEAYVNIEPRTGAYIAFGEFTGAAPDNSALQIKQYIKSTLQTDTWMVRLG